MIARLALILFAGLALLGVMATGALADAPPLVPALAEPVSSDDASDVPDGMIVVFMRPVPEGFSDGGDGFWDGFSDGGDGFSDGGDAPDGFTWVLADSFGEGFSDGGDVPDGYALVFAQPAGEDFWRDGTVPDGFVAVLAWAGDGFSDGGDVPDGFVPALLSTTTDTSQTPPGG